MKSLLESNIYETKGNILICGSCLSMMEKEAYLSLEKEYDMIFSLCLENTHMNMAIAKITSMLSTNQITHLSFASVDKSPHCVQLHYLKKEIMRVMNKHELPKIDNFVIRNSKIYKIDESVLSLSKNLIELSQVVDQLHIHN